MANNAFDRTIINPREKPLSQDINQALAQLDFAARMKAQYMLGKRSSPSSRSMTAANGFLPSSMMLVPSAPASMVVTVKAGIGFYDDPADSPSAIDSILGLDDRCSYKPLVLMNDTTFTVPAGPGVGQSRIDIIEARVNRQTGNSTSRLILDPTTGAFTPNMVDKTLSFTLDGSTGYVISPALSTVALSYKQGVAAATGAEVEPTVTPGYMKIGAINVVDTPAAISGLDIVDRRALIFPGGVIPFASAFRWNNPGGGNVYTPLHIEAPPGVQVVCSLLSLNGAGSIYVLGGEIAGGSIVLSAMATNGFSFTDRFTVGLQGVSYLNTSNVKTVDAALQTTLADPLSTYPTIEVGIGTKVLTGRIISRFVTNTGASNNSDASLSDGIIQCSGALHY